MARIFVSQTLAEAWLQRGVVALDGDLLRLAELPTLAMHIVPSVHVRSVDGGGADPYDILGAVKGTHELAQMGADHYGTSLVWGETAYIVNPGFMAIPLAHDGSELALDGATWGAILGALERAGLAA
jgi:hypothetical protein